MAVTHNILILRPIKLFSKALPSPFFARLVTRAVNNFG